MMAIGKPYNALTAEDLRTIISNEINAECIKQGLQGIAITFPAARWEWTLTIACARDSEKIELKASGSFNMDLMEGEKTVLKKIIGGSHRFTGDREYQNDKGKLRILPLEDRASPSPSAVREAENLTKFEV